MLAAAIPAVVAMGAIVATPNTASAATAPVALGTAANFAVLAGTTVTNTGPTAVTGDLGVSPGSAVTGFPPGVVTGTIHAADATAAQAQTDLTAAYTDAASRTPATTVPTQLGGTTLTPGVYNSAAGTFQITGNLTLDAQGDPNAVFIFQTASTLVTASASTVTLAGGAQACNVFWQVGSSATLGTGSTFAGNILALTSITVTTGVTVNGRTLARNGAVTLDTDTIARTICPIPPKATTTAVTSSCTSNGPGSAVTLTATVTAANGSIPTGTVTFSSDGVFLGNATLNGSGQATLTPPRLAEGEHRIIAAYPGTTLLDPSASETLTLDVGPCGACAEECDGDCDDEKADDRSTTKRHREERGRHHRDHHRLLTVQALHTLHGVIHEGRHGGHHSRYHSASRSRPVHHYKAHWKPRFHVRKIHHVKPRPHAIVTG
ncbi:ice-binding family protein [Sphaerisporangium corydalis]|uniref:Ice-binding family protein n=1 Tax=Sphaerisporangium corydalis TaxID=1441875 RepID=A0ABV9EKG1_9ACTN|nr:ice-binding family protein [Sphaerisporangium corydalis]